MSMPSRDEMSPTDGYPAKSAYGDKNTAVVYDAGRFRGLHGAWVDRRERKLMVSGLGLLRGTSTDFRVLDIPAGTGRLSNDLLGAGYVVTAGDISNEMLLQAQRTHSLSASDRFQGAVVCDAEHLPFDDHSFDAVACLRLAGHLPPDVLERVLTEFVRVTSRGAVVMLVRDALLQRLKHFLQRVRRRRARNQTWYPMKRREGERMLKSHGWKVLQRRSLLPAASESVMYVIAPPSARKGL
jgi:ubiquinone/menaquinone biosynthesis C-methylase UbiE